MESLKTKLWSKVKNSKKNGKKGFTLIELVVVIAIIAILITLIAPNLIGYTKNAKQKKADAAAKSVYTAIVANNAANMGVASKTITASQLTTSDLTTSGGLGDYFNANEVKEITTVNVKYDNGTVSAVKVTMDGLTATYPSGVTFE